MTRGTVYYTLNVMLKTRLIAAYNWLVNRLSFYHGLYKMRRWLNAGIDHPESIESFPESHPRGFIKRFRKRRISIVESYVKIIGFLESEKCNERLDALKLLAEHILHSKALKMPLNTARVQMALMKEAVKNRENKRSQMERLRDFSICSFGQPKLIRKYLNELNIIEVPETSQPLKDLDMGWDSHVHDNSSYGRKTPTQLIIDAFIKGISRLTVVYNTLSHVEIINEAIEAGRILGVTVNLGLEFAVGEEEEKFHYIYLFPHFENIKQFTRYLDENKSEFSFFLKGIEVNQEQRVQILNDMVGNFNITYLPKLNHGYPEGSIYHLEPLTLQDIDAVIPLKHATRLHMGEVLYNKFKPVLFNRVIHHRSQQKLSDGQYKDNLITEWEYRNIRKKYESTREQYRELNPDKLRAEYFPRSSSFEARSVFFELKDVFPRKWSERLTASSENIFAYREHIKIVHPLEHGLEKAIAGIIENHRFIGRVEIYNMKDSAQRERHQLETFARFIRLLNSGETEAVKQLMREQQIQFNEAELLECIGFCFKNPIIPACGSDATGRASDIPGMGFIFRKNLAQKQETEYLKQHYSLPHFISQMMSGSGDAPPEEHEIVSMGKSEEAPLLEVGDENVVCPIPIKRAWRYLHPAVKDILYILIGFIPAYYAVGLTYALIWFGITSFRNAVTDIISGRGYRPREWHFKNIDFDNLSHSLFWTGFSVPLLSFVKYEFDQLYPFGQEGFLFEFARFFFICIVNGLYLYSHNTLRGFERVTSRTNFFRSVLAWPFAAIFAPLGNLVLIPSIVQAKFWSDFVAGLIEGSGKFNLRFNLRKRDLRSLLPNLWSENQETRLIAALDLLYFFRKDPRTKNSLKYILFRIPALPRRIISFLRFKRQEKPEEFPEYDLLIQWFSESGHFFRLTDFILETYGPEQVLYLSDVVSETFGEFHKWLLKNAPRK